MADNQCAQSAWKKGEIIMTQKEIDDLRAACILANAHSKQKREEEKRNKEMFAKFLLMVAAAIVARGILESILP